MNHIISRRCSGLTFFVLLAAALVGCQSNADPSTPLGTGPKPSAAADAKPSSAPASNLPTIRIKAGADQPLKDSKGVEWAADTGFEGGMTIEEKSPEILLREDAVRQAVEAAAKRIEELDGNPLYQKAWKTAAKAVRALIK